MVDIYTLKHAVKEISRKMHITNSSSGTFRRFTIFAKNAKTAPLLKAPDEGVSCTKHP